ncbi:glycosyl hydrolase 2 galactose-binding domain-containing protein [Paenibacillus sp. HJGM_3]|uniref:glycoside hydrolase family 2 protein n=1 Tax=Paenibacillus sp. HJGM_3 TaxID=3379816 RepID=UPI00385A6467
MKQRLNENWELKGDLLSADYRDVMRREDGWIAATPLPCDVRMPLLRDGVIPEPLTADQCFASEWVEQKAWWFRREFEVTADEAAHDQAILTLESLDAEADIWLNGRRLGHHRSTFYPFVREIGKELHIGLNLLVVRVTSGLERVSRLDVETTWESVTKTSSDVQRVRGDERRVMVRKPQYVYGWDWAPRVASIGIMGDVSIEYAHRIRIGDVQAVTVSAEEGGRALLELTVEAHNLHAFATREAVVEIEITGPGGTLEAAVRAVQDVSLRSGLYPIRLRVEVPQARVWWPNGMGEAPLYTIRAALREEGGITVEYPAFRFGIRTLRLNTSKLKDGERQFTFEVNGVPVFCKGANWIPADSIYARVTEERYDRLLQEAREANFNMLRVWGGGLYERDFFYAKCDEYGLLVWQDFMFACAKYPDHLEWFRQEVEREADYQTRRLRNHSSIVLWCGNNENHWGFKGWWNLQEHGETYGGAICYNEILPRIVDRNCPDVPYWNSSPYGGEHPNGNDQGDRHHWHDCMMNKEMEKRITPEEYDKVTAKFVSEYGYIGPCRRSTVASYHGGHEIDLLGPIWELHNNTFEKDTVRAGIGKHYVDPEGLGVEAYLLYAGLCQGLMLGYSLEALRAKPGCAGALFWMFNDCWGETGWTIVDYLLTRKLAYYYVKRALAPQALILREEGDEVIVVAVNEAERELRFTLETGFAAYDGSGEHDVRRAEVALAPRSRGTVYRFRKSAAAADGAGGVHFARAAGRAQPAGAEAPALPLPATLRAGEFRRQRVAAGALALADFRREADGTVRFTVRSDRFAHAVHFNLPETLRLDDEYFDLLPGERREVVVREAPPALTLSDIRASSISND